METEALDGEVKSWLVVGKEDWEVFVRKVWELKRCLVNSLSYSSETSHRTYWKMLSSLFPNWERDGSCKVSGLGIKKIESREREVYEALKDRMNLMCLMERRTGK